MRVLFWGTPEFALPSLRAITEEGHTVTAVVTRPDRPAGRGRRLKKSEIKREAESLDVPVLQPERPSAELAARIEELAPDISVVVAYGALLPVVLLGLPRHGSINLHASLLPELRGAAPINWAIIRGVSRTGVTVMRMTRDMDAGPILAQTTVPLREETTAGELSMLLAELGAELLIETLTVIECGRAQEREQDPDRATFAPKLDRETAHLDWSTSAEEVGRWIRGCDPRPGAWSALGDTPVQLFEPRLEDEDWNEVDPPSGRPGTVIRADPRLGLVVEAAEGSLRIGAVQPAGRRRMRAEEWISGRGVRAGDRFE